MNYYIYDDLLWVTWKHPASWDPNITITSSTPIAQWRNNHWSEDIYV